MSSSSSDSDSDDFEPIRRIKINIRPLDDTIGGGKRGAADVNEIKASVKAWRPLGPPVHSSLSRRQSSLSSVSSMSISTALSSYTNNFSNNNNNNNKESSGQPNISRDYHAAGGASIHSSPSCSSLVNDFNNRSTFSNIVPNVSRTSSPLTLGNFSDSVPIAVAIQESIELIVNSHKTHEPFPIDGPKYNSCRLGNIKIAFPNAFAKGNYSKQPGTVLRLRLQPIDNINRFYASRLIKDLDSGTSIHLKETSAFSSNQLDKQYNSNGKSKMNLNNNYNTTKSVENQLVHLKPSPSIDTIATLANENHTPRLSSKVIELNMDNLYACLKKIYDQCPTLRYYNVDVLRYQIKPISSIEESPLQVCAYWKIETHLVKLRIDFKHSSKSGLNLERLREITFTIDFTNFIPQGVDVSSNMISNNNNNISGAMNMNNLLISTSSNEDPQSTNTESSSSFRSSLSDSDGTLYHQLGSSSHNQVVHDNKSQPLNNLFSQLNNLLPNLDNNLFESRSNENSSDSKRQQMPQQENNSSKTSLPSITYQPKAQWDNSIKQLTWKFDTLLSYHKTRGFGSLFAKLDFRNQEEHTGFQVDCKPNPVDVKFLITDSTMSKMNISTESTGFKMSLLKKEIRTGRYKSEPYIVT